MKFNLPLLIITHDFKAYFLVNLLYDHQLKDYIDFLVKISEVVNFSIELKFVILELFSLLVIYLSMSIFHYPLHPLLLYIKNNKIITIILLLQHYPIN